MIRKRCKFLLTSSYWIPNPQRHPGRRAGISVLCSGAAHQQRMEIPYHTFLRIHSAIATWDKRGALRQVCTG